jgi:hypothetical protein
MKKKKIKLQLFYTANKKFGSQAITLTSDSIGTHKSGWVIEGQIHEDYYTWVNMFKATHPTYGRVIGDFEKEVFADSKEGYDNFCKHHPVENWDYWDI